MDSIQERPINFHTLIHPASAFAHPDQVLRAASLDKAEKRRILSSWASDAHAMESQPWLRLIPGAEQPVPLAAILTALRWLDRDDDDPPPKGGAAIRLRDPGPGPAIAVAESQPAWTIQRAVRRHNGAARRSNYHRSFALPGLRHKKAIGAR
jgi:hypothetical protein